MEPDKFMEKLLTVVALAAMIAYGYYNLRHLQDEKAYEIGGPAKGSFSASDLIRAARVSVGGDAGFTACAPSASGDIRRCSSGDWSYVGAVGKRMDNVLRKCVWAHPITGKTIRIAFDKAQLGSSITGFYGLAEGSAIENPGVVNFTVSVDGKAAYEGASKDPGSTEFSIQTNPGTSSLEFSISTDNDRRRYFCFDAWSQTA